MDSSNQTDTPYYSPDCSEKEYGCTPIRTETIAIQTDPTEMIDITEEEPICAVDCETQTSVKSTSDCMQSVQTENIEKAITTTEVQTDTFIKSVKSTDAGSTWFQVIDLETPEPEVIVVEKEPVFTETIETQTEWEEESSKKTRSFLKKAASFFS